MARSADPITDTRELSALVMGRLKEAHQIFDRALFDAESAIGTRRTGELEPVRMTVRCFKASGWIARCDCPTSFDDPREEPPRPDLAARLLPMALKAEGRLLDEVGHSDPDAIIADVLPMVSEMRRILREPIAEARPDDEKLRQARELIAARLHPNLVQLYEILSESGAEPIPEGGKAERPVGFWEADRLRSYLILQEIRGLREDARKRASGLPDAVIIAQAAEIIKQVLRNDLIRPSEWNATAREWLDANAGGVS